LFAFFCFLWNRTVRCRPTNSWDHGHPECV
jgi:hypothetical protein